MKYTIEPHLKRARELLLSDDEHSLRYASLELRLAIEAHVYNQLRAGMDTIPESVINTWQPPQAIRLLSEFEETADKDLYVEITTPDGEKETIEYKNIKYSELRSLYNTLGSNLHQPTIKKIDTYKIKKQSVQGVLDKLEKLQGYNLITFHRPYNVINCEKCKKDILYTNNSVIKNSILNCQAPDCQNYYVIRITEDDVIERFCRASFLCISCESEISLHLFELDKGGDFTCKNCGKDYEVTNGIFSDGIVTKMPKFNFDGGANLKLTAED
ncbi:hypothetical protein [Pantoea ananatis]|uniref:hypothetical protein n=1 Tax=Pantoea ananas TaxID=553 RepID=UPI001F4EDCB4|nr:hypothetical protein [Pantoea ananatis]MCH9267730.1 hypothetical protein [Pantoea ananatis]